MVKIRPATHADIISLYGKRHHRSMRAIVATIDEVPKGIAGLYYDKDKLVAFSDFDEELRAYPFLIYKAAIKIRDMIKTAPCTVYAVAHPDKPGADKLLKHIGFEYVGKCREGDIYQWMQE